MEEDNILEKTTRINMLFAFYETLLTEKQRTFLTCYFQDDFSLGEIATEYGISRQAVYEHIKRAEAALEEYESKLNLLADYEKRTAEYSKLENLLDELAGPDNGQEKLAKLDDVKRQLRILREIDEL